MSATGLKFIFIRCKLAFMHILKRVLCLLDPQKEFKRQIIEYCTKRDEDYTINYGDDSLLKLVKFSKRPNISELTKEDIYSFVAEIRETGTQYKVTEAVRSIRSLLRYFKHKKVICVHPSCIKENETFSAVSGNMADMIGSTIPKPDRNKDLVEKRISDPDEWSFTKLGLEFGISKVTAYQLFERHALKYIEPRIYKEYREKMRIRSI